MFLQIFYGEKMNRILITILLLLSLICCNNKNETENNKDNLPQNTIFSLFNDSDNRDVFYKKYEKLLNSYSDIFISKTLAWNFLQYENELYFIKCYMGGDVNEFEKITLVEIVNNTVQEYLLLTKENCDFEYFETSSFYIIEDINKNKYIDIFLGVLGSHYTGGQRLILNYNNKQILLSEYDYNFPNKESKYYLENNLLIIYTSKDIFSKESYSDEASRINDRKFKDKYYQLQPDKTILVDLSPVKINDNDVIIKKGFNALQFF
jgi:hypothetical protein